MDTGTDDPLFGNHASDLLRGALDGSGRRAPKTPWEPPTAGELAAMLPQYEIEAVLGQGGMGAVYKGRQISLDRPVAIKILAGELEETDQGFNERFKNEARAMAKLSHPGIVGVYEFGQTPNGLLYIVMEFIDGTDVALMIANQGRLHSDHAMAITAHVCDALAYAHQRGIIHRDIKPANIMVGYDGVVKVADFGLAKISQAHPTGLTQSGMAMGTLFYMAPEALMIGSALDQRADIYAVGVMLFQMLTGKLPQGLFELPSLQVPGLDPRYDAIIGKALREDRERRYPSALDMRHDLDAILTQPVVKVEPGAEKAPAALPSKARPPRPGGPENSVPARSRPKARPKQSRGGILAWVVLLLLVGVGTLHFLSPDQDAAAPSVPLAPDRGEWIDLLALVDPAAGTVSGKWTRVAEGLHGERLPDGEGAQVLQLPYEPPEEYDFRVAFTTLEGNAEISQILSAFDRQFTWGTASGQPEKWAGFNMVNRKPMMQSGAGVKLPARRELNRRYESLVEVRRDRVTGYVDGEKLVEWQTDYSDFSMDPTHTIPNPRALGIGIWWSKTVFHDISVREVTGQGKVLSEPEDATGTTEVTAAPSPAAPVQATKDKPFVNSLGMKFVPVPDTDILMCIHETRKGDYAAYAAKNANIDELWKNPNYQGIPVSSGDDHPVCNVSWDDAKSFCAWLSKEEGRVYRLPTDREWSMAVGIGGGEDARLTPGSLNEKIPGEYTWGTQWPPPKGAGNYADTATKEVFPELKTLEGYTDGFATSSPVMSFLPNTLGIYDLAGNVWEFCGDFFDKAQTMRVVRGGCWGDGGDFPRPFLATGRNGNKPEDRHNSRGFRCVLDLKDKPGTEDEVVAPPPSPSLPDEEGFTPLLNSIHHEGWQTAAGGEVEGLDFSDGVLTINPSSQWPDYYWYLKQTYADFVLRLEYKLVTRNGNSGIPLRVQVPSNHPRKHNYECDVSNSSDPLQASGAFMGVKAPIARAQKDGGWNELEITAIGQKYRVTLNGVLVNDFTGDRSTRGYIGLQLNVATVQYRNIRIKDLVALPVSKPAVPVTLPTGPTTWTDTKGRSLTATFKAIASGNVLLDIAGKITPVPLNTLSAESQRLAQQMDAARQREEASDPAKATKEKPFVNSLGMKFVPVPGTELLMCVHETRRQDYAEYALQVPGVHGQWKQMGYKGLPAGHEEMHPVVGVNWDDGNAFCQWLSQKDHLNYRLPTDREWSIAAGLQEKQSAQTTPEMLDGVILDQFPWGGGKPPRDVSMAGNYVDTSYIEAFKTDPKRLDGIFVLGHTDGFPTTAPVMSFRPNALGFYDLGGNVREWCADWYNAAKQWRVLRGSSWQGFRQEDLLTSGRAHITPQSRLDDCGFRIVLDPASKSATADAGTPAIAASVQASDKQDAAMAELLAFEKTLRSHTWLIPDRNWELRFENNHRAPIDERVHTTRWHWWVTGPRSLHVQFAAMPAAYDPYIGVEYIFDEDMKTITTGTGKRTAVRAASLGEPAEADLGRSFAPDYAKKFGGSLPPQFPSL